MKEVKRKSRETLFRLRVEFVAGSDAAPLPELSSGRHRFPEGVSLDYFDTRLREYHSI
jgi:hypothetical protein